MSCSTRVRKIFSIVFDLEDLVDKDGNVLESSVEPLKYLRVKEALGRCGDEVNKQRRKMGGVLTTVATQAFKVRAGCRPCC